MSAQPRLVRAGEDCCQYAVQVSASVQVAPPRITLRWPRDQITKAIHYRVFRKGCADHSWGQGMDVVDARSMYVDDQVQVGTAYEYQVVKSTPSYTAYGYICSGIEVPITENRGKLLLVVDNTYAPDLAYELARLEQDLTGDGWRVHRLDVNRSDSVVKIKRLIQGQYDADQAGVNCVFLFGHVPVPYSGNIAPDGHDPAHQGAWPCDGYYADMDGTWTDRAVHETRATETRNHNVPGDGKFDQSTFPASLRLMVGRVDLANMPGRGVAGGSATFPSELELLRNYLNKDHKFRNKQLELPRCGLLGDYFGAHNGEAFAASGWRNLSPLFGPDNLSQASAPGTWISTLSAKPFLCAYGCGPGTYESIAGLGAWDRHHSGTTVELFRHDIKAAFVLLYGSWLGDWDSEDDLLRAVLALPTWGLACAWAGRPHWFLHHMGLGEPIGFSTRLTQNNGAHGQYQSEVNTAAGQVHVALMGDPTLRLHAVAPPTKLAGFTGKTGITLKWNASDDSVIGYYVYRANCPDGPFVRLTSRPITNTHFSDTTAPGSCDYMVRAVKLETTASGTYFNLSQGCFLAPIGHGSDLSGGS